MFLQEEDLDFTIVFRTFGSDMADVAAELNLFATGQHPSYPVSICQCLCRGPFPWEAPPPPPSLFPLGSSFLILCLPPFTAFPSSPIRPPPCHFQLVAPFLLSLLFPVPFDSSAPMFRQPILAGVSFPSEGSSHGRSQANAAAP